MTVLIFGVAEVGLELGGCPEGKWAVKFVSISPVTRLEFAVGRGAALRDVVMGGPESWRWRVKSVRN